MSSRTSFSYGIIRDRIMSKNEKHFHIYKKRQFASGRIYWSCTEAGCNHYRHDLDMPGRDAKCPYCSEKFKITRQQISGGQALLHCSNCYSPRGFGRKKYLQQVQEKTEKMLKDRYADKLSIDSIFESVLESQSKKRTEENNNNENGNSGQENTGTE